MRAHTLIRQEAVFKHMEVDDRHFVLAFFWLQ
jgi:hypothetical protein